MSDGELLVALAEIAGVFVGFGALIGFTRSGGFAASDRLRVNGVVLVGLLVVAGALIPVGLGRYSLESSTVWRLSSFAYLLLIWVVNLAPFRDAADRSFIRSQKAEPVRVVVMLSLELLLQAPLVLVLLGVSPGSASALYTTAVVVNILQVSFMLGELVLSRPAAGA